MYLTLLFSNNVVDCFVDSELTLQQNNDNSDSEDIANRGYAGKKTTQFEPSEAPALTYAEFDPDSARFEKYHD